MYLPSSSHRKLGALVARAQEAEAAHYLRHAHAFPGLLLERVEYRGQYLLTRES